MSLFDLTLFDVCRPTKDREACFSPTRLVDLSLLRWGGLNHDKLCT
jgi:hypothetical protein